MKIALLGYGKMGKMIEQAALKRNHTIVARVDSSTPLTLESIQDADVCIDFSHPSCILDHIHKVASFKKNLVIGTTGWNEHLGAVESVIKTSGIAAIHSPNFSLGVQLLFRIVDYTSTLMNAFEEYDVAGVEFHHKQKADAPSGTGKKLASIVESRMDLVTTCPMTSVRCGSIPGTHTMLFESPIDRIEITHQAYNREGFAKGSVMAAEWIEGKTGCYTFEELIESLIQKGEVTC